MKRSDPSAGQPNRRSLILHHHPLLQDPQVVAFLDNTSPTPLAYQPLAGMLVRANEPALLLELTRATQRTQVMLCSLDDAGDSLPLPDGMLEYVAQHINEATGVTSLLVIEGVLSTVVCSKLQATLNAPTCQLTSLLFSNCTWADAHVQFPVSAPTIEAFDWSDDPGAPAQACPMDRVIPALAGWQKLGHVCLMCPDSPFNFALITQLLLANPHINGLYLVSDVAPVAPGNPGHLPQQDPALLFDALQNDRTAVTQLTFQVLDTHNHNFNDYCLQRLAGCLMNNTTLELLDVPGIRMCTAGPRQQFSTSLQHNRSLISLTPLDVFGNQVPPPVRRNKRQRYWFTQDFVLGAAEAFMQTIGLPKDAGTRMSPHLAPTSVERSYCGALMTLLCKATHDGAVKLRSAGLREAIKIYIKTGDHDRCLELVTGLLEFHMDLLPEDKQDVVAFAKAQGRVHFLPAGYAG